MAGQQQVSAEPLQEEADGGGHMELGSRPNCARVSKRLYLSDPYSYDL